MTQFAILNIYFFDVDVLFRNFATWKSIHNKMKLTSLQTLYIILIALNALLIASSCDNEEEKARLSRAQKEQLRREDSLSLKVAILPTSDCDFIREADSLGYFDSLGVVVHLRKYNSLSECRYALNHKMVEAAVIDSSLAKTIESVDTVKLTLSRSTQLRWRMITAKKSRVRRYGQLADKVIAADSHGMSHDLASAAIDSVKKKKKDVFIVQCEDVNIRCKMLCTGNVDAAMLPSPFDEIALRSGGYELPLDNEKTYGVIAFRSAALKDKRIKKQHDIFLKACELAEKDIKRQKARKGNATKLNKGDKK